MDKSVIIYQRPHTGKIPLLKRVKNHISTIIMTAFHSFFALIFTGCAILVLMEEHAKDYGVAKNIILTLIIEIAFLLLIAYLVGVVVSTLKTDIVINSIISEDGTITINYVLVRKMKTKSIKTTRINAEITQFPVGLGGRILYWEKGITIYDYGDIALQQRINDDVMDEKTMEKVVDAIRKVRAESGNPLPWL